MTNEYAEALAAHNAAFSALNAVRADYRAMKVGDSEFLTAKAAFAEATREYDDAFSKEAA
jgi:hypothetical protein